MCQFKKPHDLLKDILVHNESPQYTITRNIVMRLWDWSSSAGPSRIRFTRPTGRSSHADHLTDHLRWMPGSEERDQSLVHACSQPRASGMSSTDGDDPVAPHRVGCPWHAILLRATLCRRSLRPVDGSTHRLAIRPFHSKTRVQQGALAGGDFAP